MDFNMIYDTRSIVMCGMLFSTMIAMTADAPAAVPEVFQRLWHRYQIFQRTRKCKPAAKAGEKFWEIDMTNFEP